jgi:hypothetical protein
MGYFDKVHEKNPKIDLEPQKNKLVEMTKNYIMTLQAGQKK